MSDAASPTHSRRAFVTGSTGFVGLNLVRELRAQGWEVTALHRATSNTRYLQGLGLKLVVGDILDPDSLLAAMPQGLDAVFHVAGDTSLWSGNDEKQTRINVEGTGNVVEAALEKKAGRFIHTSTTSAFGRHDAIVSESTPSRAQHSSVNYEKSKWQGEQLVLRTVRERGLDAVVLNPAAILGPYDQHTWARTFYMLRDGKIAALPPGCLSFNHVREIVNAHIAAVDKGVTGEQYILAGETMYLADMLRKMGVLLECKVPSMTAPGFLLQLMGLMMGLIGQLTGKEPDITPEMAAFMARKHVYDSSKAKQVLGMGTVGLDECLRDSFDWLRQENLL